MTIANKHVDELYSAVDQLEAEMIDFMRLLMTDLKKHVINVPVQKKQVASAGGKPLDIMPYQRGEVRRKKRRVPTLNAAAPAAAGVSAPTTTTKKRTREEGDEEEEDEEDGNKIAASDTTTIKKPKRAPRVKKTKTLPLPLASKK